MVFNAISMINGWGILAAAAVGFVIAGIYFGVLTPKHYAVALGREDKPQTKPSPLFILGPFACNLVMIVTTATIMRLMGIASLHDALALGGLIGIGYLLAMCMTIAINPNFPKPFYYTLLNAPYFLGNMIITSAILFWLR